MWIDETNVILTYKKYWRIANKGVCFILANRASNTRDKLPR